MVIVVANGDDENLKNAVISCNMWLIQPTLPVGIETLGYSTWQKFNDGPKRKRSPVGIETPRNTTVALLFGKEQESLPGSATRRAVRRGALAEPPQPAPTRQSSALGRQQAAACRSDCGSVDVPVRPLS